MEAGDEPLLASPAPDASVVLIATTGTTGQPKFVAHTPRTLKAMADGCSHLGIDPTSRPLVAFPMMHASGVACLAMTLNQGAATSHLADFKVPERLVVVEKIARNALGKVNRSALAQDVADGAI